MRIFKQGRPIFKNGTIHINNEKLGQLYIFSLKKVLIVYLVALKRGAIRHTHPTMLSIDSYIPPREYLWSIIALILTDDFVFSINKMKNKIQTMKNIFF